VNNPRHLDAENAKRCNKAWLDWQTLADSTGPSHQDVLNVATSARHRGQNLELGSINVLDGCAPFDAS
jgi:hypothetical protein